VRQSKRTFVIIRDPTGELSFCIIKMNARDIILLRYILSAKRSYRWTVSKITGRLGLVYNKTNFSLSRKLCVDGIKLLVLIVDIKI